MAVRGCGVLGNDKSGFAEAVRAAKSADVAILVVGESQRRHEHEAGEQEPPSDGEGHDVVSLDLKRRTGRPHSGCIRNRNPHRSGAGQRTAIIHALDRRARAGHRGGVVAGRARWTGGGRRAVWRLQPHWAAGYHDSASRRPVARLLQLPALQGVLDAPWLDQQGRLRRYAWDTPLPLRIRFKLCAVRI